MSTKKVKEKKTYLKDGGFDAMLYLLSPCQWGSHPDSQAYKLIVIL